MIRAVTVAVGISGHISKALLYGIVGGLLLGTSRFEGVDGAILFLLGLSSSLLAMFAFGLLLYAVSRGQDACVFFVHKILRRDPPSRAPATRTSSCPSASAFFRLLVAPVVSCGVYAWYAVLVVRVLRFGGGIVSSSGGDGDSVRKSLALAIAFGIAFLIAACVQLSQMVFGQFWDEVDASSVLRKRGARRLVLLISVVGRVGFFGRFALFFSVFILCASYVFQERRTRDADDAAGGESLASHALNVLLKSRSGRLFLACTGVSLCFFYAPFAATFALFRAHPLTTLAPWKRTPSATLLPTAPAAPLLLGAPAPEKPGDVDGNHEEGKNDEEEGREGREGRSATAADTTTGVRERSPL